VAGLDQLLLDPTRLAIVALLAAAEWAEFGFVRDSVGLSDSALSKQVSNLSKSDYVEVRKGYVGKRPRTWLNLTEAGRDKLAGHISALQGIAEKARSDGARQTRDQGVP
jgi:DNA-binding MarR family transcriptional regulator